MPQIVRLADLEEVSLAAARWLGERIPNAVQARGFASIALAGGETPMRLHELLGDVNGEWRRLPWDHIHVFWGDERCVPHDHPASNFGRARGPLLSRVPIPPSHVHPVPVPLGTPTRVARAYERELRAFLAPFSGDGHTLDIVILGLGSDGHIASLFPHQKDLATSSTWVKAVTAPAGYEPRRRITLTLPFINSAGLVLFLVSGRDKSAVLRSVLAGRARRGSVLPAAMVRPREGVTWLVDATALAAPLRRAANRSERRTRHR